MIRKKHKVKKIYSKKFLLFIFIIILFYIIHLRNKYEIILDYPKFILDEYKIIFNLLNKNNNFDLFNNKTKIENIFILIMIFPFLKKEIIITKKNAIYELCMKFISFKKKRIKIKKNYFTKFSAIFKSFIFYKWETLPNKNKTNYLRHILYHYYNDECLNIYEESLNINIKYYFDNEE